jgi:hypothetical protein
MQPRRTGPKTHSTTRTIKSNIPSHLLECNGFVERTGALLVSLARRLHRRRVARSEGCARRRRRFCLLRHRSRKARHLLPLLPHGVCCCCAALLHEGSGFGEGLLLLQSGGPKGGTVPGEQSVEALRRGQRLLRVGDRGGRQSFVVGF